MSCESDCDHEYFKDVEAADNWFTQRILQCMTLPTQAERDACVKEAIAKWQGLKEAAAQKRADCILKCQSQGGGGG